MNSEISRLTADYINSCYETLIERPESIYEIIRRGVLRLPKPVVDLPDFDQWGAKGPRRELSHCLKSGQIDIYGASLILADPFFEVKEAVHCDEVINYTGNELCALYKFSSPSEKIEEISDYFSMLNYSNPVCFISRNGKHLESSVSFDDLFGTSSAFLLLAFDEMDFIEWTLG